MSATDYLSYRNIRIIFLFLIAGYVAFLVVHVATFTGCNLRFGVRLENEFTVRDSARGLVEIGNLIVKAKKYAKSARTHSILIEALELISKELVSKEEEVEQLGPTLNGTNSSTELPDVCREVYVRGMLDAPYYERGWEFQKCRAKPLESIVTGVINARALHKSEVFDLISQFKLQYPKLPLLVSVSPDVDIADDETPNVKVFNNFNGALGWASLVDLVKTKYLVLLRDVNRFTNYSSIERLVSVSSRFNVTFVGGATVAQNGHWWHGCYLTELKNYSLTYEHGYDFSRDSCWFCDHLSGPFLARTGFLKATLSSLKHKTDDVIFKSLFLSVSRDASSMSCPDVMFHVDRIAIEKEDPKQSWLPIAKELKLNKLVSFTGGTHMFSCEEASISCSGFDAFKGRLVPPCCLENLNVCIKPLMRFAQEHNVFIDIRFGTLLGALKFKGALPWDIDADFQYHQANHSTLVKAVPHLKEFGCSLHLSGKYAEGDMNANGWYVDVTLVGVTPSLFYRSRTGYNQTYVLFDGAWLQAPPNPGRILRLLYKHEIYKHANSHRHTGRDLHSSYIPGKFMTCPVKDVTRHYCLDKYYTDGARQFT